MPTITDNSGNDWRAQTQQHIDNVQKLLAGFVEHVLMDCMPEDPHIIPGVHEAKALPELVVTFSEHYSAMKGCPACALDDIDVDGQVREVLLNTIVAYDLRLNELEEQEAIPGGVDFSMHTFLCNGILARAVDHDASKLEEPEAPIFAEYTAKLKGCTYGSDEYKEYLKEMKPALDHHYANNPHHPEHHEGGVNDMTLVDVVEMAMDWYAAGLRHADGNYVKSVEFNRERFKLTSATARLLRGTEAFFVMVRPQLKEG